MHEPPVIADVQLSPPTVPKLSRTLLAAVVTVGFLHLTLGIVATGLGPQADNIPFRIGALIGGLALWPLILIGIFSIWRRFRNAKTRAIIALSVWSLVTLGHVGNLSESRRREKVNQARQSTLAPSPADVAQASLVLPLSGAAKPIAQYNVVLDPSYDFSPGSDQRLIKLIDQAQQDRYHSIVAAYAVACATRPNDAVVALERVNFIERFLYSEDLVIESAEADQAAALKYLKTRFPTAAGTVLYELARSYGPEFQPKAASVAHLIAGWTKADQAQFFLLRANAEEQGARAGIDYANRSFELNPTTTSGLRVAQAAKESGDREKCLRVLRNPVFDQALSWEKQQKLMILFEVGENAEAMTLYEALLVEAPLMLRQADMAMRLAKAGYREKARELFATITPNDWNREELLRLRFLFELEFGHAAEAGAAYQALRRQSWTNDLFLRERAKLLKKYPGTGWSFRDLVGAVCVGMLLVTALFLPAVLLMPVHYWSLLRIRKGKLPGWPNSRWGLRTAACLLGVILVSQVIAVWIYAPAALFINRWDVIDSVVQANVLPMQLIMWASTVLMLVLIFWCSRAWTLLGRGDWSWRKVVVTGLGATVLFRFGLGVYGVILPEAVFSGTAASSPQIAALAQVLHSNWGGLGLISIFALLVPILEEALFRGVLLQALARHIPFGWANAIQALVFAGVHESLALLPFFFSFGVVAGIFSRRSGGLLTAVIMHVGNNLIVCIAFLSTR